MTQENNNCITKETRHKKGQLEYISEGTNLNNCQTTKISRNNREIDVIIEYNNIEAAMG